MDTNNSALASLTATYTDSEGEGEKYDSEDEKSDRSSVSNKN